jgi:aspartate ammonia-lyase
MSAQPDLPDQPALTDLAMGPHTRRSTEVMGVSGRTLGSCPPLRRALGQVKVATARANGEAGVLEAPIAGALADAAALIADGRVDPAAFPADLLAGGGSIAVHMNLNEVLATMASATTGQTVDPKAHAGASQSTADVCHTASRLAVLDRAEHLLAAVDGLLARLTEAADRLEPVTTLARTCLQDAVAAPLSTVFEGSAEAIARRAAALAGAMEPLHQVVLGATVIGRGDHADPAYRAVVVTHLAAVTGRPLVVHPGPAGALQHGDDLVAVSAAVAQLTHPLLKLAADLRLLGSGPAGGFGEVLVPDVLDGSSFFRGKRNPVVAETLIQACIQVQGLDHAVQLAAGRAELYLQVLDGLVTIDVLDQLDLLATAVERFDRFVLADLQADARRCAELAALTSTGANR